MADIISLNLDILALPLHNYASLLRLGAQRSCLGDSAHVNRRRHIVRRP